MAMALTSNTELLDKFTEFFEQYYETEIVELIKNSTDEQNSLHVDWQDLTEFDSDLAIDVQNSPTQLQEYAEEALRLYPPENVSLGGAHVRFRNLEEQMSIQDIDTTDQGQLRSLQCVVAETGAIEPKPTTSAFECQRCGTLTRIPQSDGYQEPHECQGCERQGPFRVNHDQTEFTEAQQVRLYDSHALAGEAQPETIEAVLFDDLVGAVDPGTEVILTVVVTIENNGDDGFEYGFEIVDVETVTDDPVLSSAAFDITTNESPLTVETPTKTGSVTLPLSAATGAALATHPDAIREEETKTKFITPFLTSLGWVKYDYTEWKMEYEDADTNLRVDYALFGPESASPDIVVEAKQLNTNLNLKETQIFKYLHVFDATWGILTDGRVYRVYYNGSAVESEDVPLHLTTITLSDLLGERPPILAALTRAQYYETESKDMTARIQELASAELQPGEADSDDDETQITARKRSESSDEETLLDVILEKEREHTDGAPIDEVIEAAAGQGLDPSTVEKEIQKLKHTGEVYEPQADYLQTTL